MDSGPRLRGASSKALLRAVLCLYVLAAALMPLGHHDVACHLKSTTHCTTCVVGASTDLASNATALTGCGLDDAGVPTAIRGPFVPEALIGASSGRAPPTI